TNANCSIGNGICIGYASTASASNSIALGNSTSNSVASSCLIGDSSITSIRPNNNNTCDLGIVTTNAYKNIYANGSLIGTVKTSVIDASVTGPASAILDSICTYNGTSGKIIQDSGIVSSNIFKVDGTVSMTGVFNQSNTTDSTLVSNGSIVTLGG